MNIHFYKSKSLYPKLWIAVSTAAGSLHPKKFAAQACIFLVLFGASLYAQTWFTISGSENERAINRTIVQQASLSEHFASDIRPYPVNAVSRWAYSLPTEKHRAVGEYNRIWLINENDTTARFESAKVQAKTKTKIFSNPAKFLEIQNDKIYLSINPAFDFSAGYSKDEELPLFVNTRALTIEGSLVRKLGFHTRVEENQMRLAKHEQLFYDTWLVLPGAHYIKGYRTRAYDFMTAHGYITFSPIREIMLQFGQDRNFIGNGMRSLLLSDFAPSYPFLKVHTKVGKVDYVNLYARLTDRYTRLINPYQHLLLPEKYMSMHYLSVQINRRWRLGLFETVMFHDNNNTGKGFDVSYLNPVILFASVEHQRGDADKISVGLNNQYLITEGLGIYGQFLLNEFRLRDLVKNNGSFANKFGIQLGLHLAAENPIPGFELQLELNRIRPYTYTHYTVSGNYPVNSYSHQNQPLAHPMGANLNEWLIRLKAQPWPKIQACLFAQYTFYGADSAGSNWGGNIFLDYLTYERETGNVIGQGVGKQLFNLNAWVAYELRHALTLSLEARMRRLRSDITSRNSTDAYLGLALRYRMPAKMWHY